MNDHFLGNGNSTDEKLPELVKPDQLTISFAEDGNENVRIEDDPEKLLRYMQEIIIGLGSFETSGEGKK